MSEYVHKKDLLKYLDELLCENAELVPEILDLRVNKRGFYSIGIMQGEYHGVKDTLHKIKKYLEKYKTQLEEDDDFDEDDLSFKFPDEP